jgi:hypothetical protein
MLLMDDGNMIMRHTIDEKDVEGVRRAWMR